MRRNTKSQGQFLKEMTEIHGTKFDYSLVEYKNNRTPVTIKCNFCKTIFSVIPFNLKNQKNCPSCSILNQRNNTDDFIKLAKEIHGDNYDYSLTSYINAKTKVKIKCNVCKNVFFQLPRGHIYEKSGCPTCRQSHGEEKISLILKFLNIQFFHNHTFSDCIGKVGVPLKFDFYLPVYNMCIEFDGKQHTDRTSIYWTPTVEINDQIKNEYCRSKNILLKRIPFTEIKRVDEIVKTLIFF